MSFQQDGDETQFLCLGSHASFGCVRAHLAELRVLA